MTLSRITGKRATAVAIGHLRKTFRERGKRVQRGIGHHGGQAPSAYLDVVNVAGVWLAYVALKGRHWCAFGTLPLPKTGNAPITVEINPPKEGINRRVAGLLATDDAGRVYLCHTGGIGGSKKGVGKAAFLEWTDRHRVPIADSDGGSTLAFPIAEVGSKRAVEHVSRFVYEVADFKSGRKPPRQAVTRKGFFGGSDKEFEGRKRISANSGYTAYCDHGIIRNGLAELIRLTGRDVTRDRERDLLVGRISRPDAEFEIKTSADPQSIYTALGQLLLHSAMKPVKRKVMVLPAEVEKKWANAIGSVGIELVTYRWTDTRIRFIGLNRIIPDAGNSAPINRPPK